MDSQCLLYHFVSNNSFKFVLCHLPILWIGDEKEITVYFQRNVQSLLYCASNVSITVAWSDHLIVSIVDVFVNDRFFLQVISVKEK